jgi:hypothetical protein
LQTRAPKPQPNFKIFDFKLPDFTIAQMISDSPGLVGRKPTAPDPARLPRADRNRENRHSGIENLKIAKPWSRPANFKITDFKLPDFTISP